MFLVMSTNNCGYQEALLDLNMKKLVNDDVSHQAINNKVLSGKFGEHLFTLVIVHLKRPRVDTTQKNVCGRWITNKFESFVGKKWVQTVER